VIETSVEQQRQEHEAKVRRIAAEMALEVESKAAAASAAREAQLQGSIVTPCEGISELDAFSPHRNNPFRR
jgi:hypothetical protein